MLGGEKLKNPTVENSSHNSLFLKDFMYLFLERGVGREKERERNIVVQEIHRSVASHTPPTEDLAQSPGMCPNWESNQRPFGCKPVVNPLSHTTKGSPLFFFNMDLKKYFCFTGNIITL